MILTIIDYSKVGKIISGQLKLFFETVMKKSRDLMSNRLGFMPKGQESRFMLTFFV